jgi:inositol-pentakisphosphate 2-kinase
MSAPAFFTSGEAPRLHAGQPVSKDDPSHAIRLEYLNEGGANFVFRILPTSEGNSLPSNLDGQLLRLRKDLPHVQASKQQLANYDEYFKPLFPEKHLIQHTPIELHNGLLTAINAALKDHDRPSHRLQDFLPESESHGLLVTDMTPRPDDVLLQVKPKWLSQSPTAPTDAKRCRTCALRAQRASRKVKTATDAQESCPLALISSNEADRRQTAKAVSDNARLQDYLVNEAQPLLQTLRENQLRLDPKGVLHENSVEDILDVCTAMTLRDCTLFLKLSGDSIDARLADLDMKQLNKLSQWKKVEQQLIDEGWYTNTEDKSFWTEERVCLLSRK